MRVGVVDGVLARQRAVFAQHGDDILVRVEHVLAHQRGHAHVLGVLAVVVHGREHGEAVLAPDDEILVAVAGRDVDAARARFERDELAQDDRPLAVEERVLEFPALQFAAEERAVVGGIRFADVARGLAKRLRERVGQHERFDLTRVRVAVTLRAITEARVDGDGLVRRERPGGRGPDDDARLARQRAGHERELDVDRRTRRPRGIRPPPRPARCPRRCSSRRVSCSGRPTRVPRIGRTRGGPPPRSRDRASGTGVPSRRTRPGA